jgi:hypothetical protein
MFTLADVGEFLHSRAKALRDRLDTSNGGIRLASTAPLRATAGLMNETGILPEASNEIHLAARNISRAMESVAMRFTARLGRLISSSPEEPPCQI